MEDLKAEAILRLKEPASLSVEGSVTTYRSDDKITISKKEPQGINPTILLLDIEIIDGISPKKGTTKSFSYNSHDNVEDYEQITFRNQQINVLTIDIDIRKS